MFSSSLARFFALFSLIVGCGSSTPNAPAQTQGGEQEAPAQEVEAPEEEAPPEPSVVDPLVASPDVFKLILDGERIRVLEATWQPSQRDRPHGHPALVAYAVTQIFGIAYDHEENMTSIRIQKGRILHQTPVPSHAFENRSKEVAKLLLFEIKPGQPRASIPKDAAPDALAASPNHYELISIDAQIRVLLGTWEPGEKDNLHGHPAFTAYAITDIQGKLHDESGKTTDVVTKAGTALFQDPVKAHAFENTGTSTAQLLLIEQRK